MSEFIPKVAEFRDRKTPYGFNNYRLSKKIQVSYKVENCKIDNFWDDVIYAEEDKSVDEQNSRYKRYKKKN